MKKYLFSAFVFFCYFLAVLASGSLHYNTPQAVTGKPDTLFNKQKEPAENTPRISRYNLSVKLSPEKKQIFVSGSILWFNNKPVAVSELFINCFSNSLTNSSAPFLSQRKQYSDPETGIKFSSFSILGNSFTRTHIHSFNSNASDSSLFKFALSKPIPQGDSALITFSYQFQLPSVSSRSMVLGDEDGLLFAQWFPRVAVLSDTGWAPFPLLPFAEFNQERIQLSVTALHPASFTLLMPSVTTKQIENAQMRSHTVVSVTDIPLTFVKHEKVETASVQSNKQTLLIKYYKAEEDSKLPQNEIRRSVEFLTSVIGNYPEKELMVIPTETEMPGITGMEYSSLIVIPPISGEIDTETEAVLFHEIAHQYFYHAVRNNEVTEAWLDEGLVSYLTRKYRERLADKHFASFRMLGVYPVKGIQLMEYNKIPVIFTLESIEYDYLSDELLNYYSLNSAGSLITPSHLFTDSYSYYTTSYVRGSLLFASLERFFGEKKLFAILASYYRNNKNGVGSTNRFAAEIERAAGKEAREIYGNLIRLNGPVDDKIENVIENGNELVVNIRRLGDKTYPLSLTIATQTDTVRKVITTDKRFVTYRHKISSPYRYVEIDERRLNVFDENFANNSRTSGFQYGAFGAFLLRWYFWMQNVLVIFGGIA